MNFDVKRAREETLGCDDVIHFNNAGSSLMPMPVSDFLHAYLYQEERIGGYETAAAQKRALENFYIATAKLLNCAPDEIAYVENATRAWDMAFYAFDFAPGDKILTSIAEYGSNIIAFLQVARRTGAEVVFVPDDATGQIDVDALAEMVDDRAKLIAISHIPTGGGLVNPAAAVGKVAKAAGVPFLLDACQSVGQLPMDVEEIGCDLLSGTGRKYLRGPRGTGFLYVRRSLIDKLEPPMLDQHAATLHSRTAFSIRTDARRFENWERFYAGQAALGVAIDYALEWGLEPIQARIYHLASILRDELAQLNGVAVEDVGAEQCGLVTWRSRSRSGDYIKRALAAQKINVSLSTGSGSLVSFKQRGITELVRSSLHYFNTEEEIGRFIQALKPILGV